MTIKEVSELIASLGVFLTGASSLIKVLRQNKKLSTKKQKAKNHRKGE